MKWTPITLTATYEAVVRGTGLWIAFGTFLDDWRYSAGHNPSHLAAMLTEPIIPQLNTHREAAFFQAVGEHLLASANVRQYPERLTNPRWVLEEPWFLYPGWRLRAWQLVTTPAAFKSRNIFGGDRIFNRI